MNAPSNQRVSINQASLPTAMIILPERVKNLALLHMNASNGCAAEQLPLHSLRNDPSTPGYSDI